MELLLLKSAACLAIFMVFYKLVLEKRPYHHLKRFYLLGSLLLSIVIPLITLTEYVQVSRDTATIDFFENTMPAISNSLEALPEEPTNYVPIILWSIYAIGVLIFTTKFFINLKGLYTRIYRNERRKTSPFIHVLLKDLLPPHTFFNYIFLNKSKFENNAIPKEVLLHEETHAKQKHSIDILFIELLQVIFWFNPLFYFIKKDIKLNHEFLADAAVLKKGISPKTYQHILLQFSSKEHDFQLANAINYSSIKKRFTLMKTQTSKQKTWLVSLMIIPLLAVLVYGFSSRETVEVYSDTDTVYNNYSQQKESNELQKLAEINSYTKQYFKVKTENGEFVEKRFYELDDKNKKKWVYVESIPFYRKKLSENELKGYLTSEDYVIKINSNDVDSKDFDKYSASDFITYSITPISALAKMREGYVLNLITKTLFNSNIEASLIMYNQLLPEFESRLKKENEESYSKELLSIYDLLNHTYKRFTPQIIKKNNLVAPTEISSQKMDEFYSSFSKIPVLYVNKDNEIFLNKNPILFTNLKEEFNRVVKNKKTTLILESEEAVSMSFINRITSLLGGNLKSLQIASSTKLYNDQQKPLSAKELAEYNVWAKKINAESKVLSEDATFFPPINEQDFIKFSKIYKRMSAQQKENSEEMPFPDFDIRNSKPKFSTPSTPQQKGATKKQLAEYNAWAKVINEKMAKAETKKGNDKWSEYPIVFVKDVKKYKAIYNLMTEAQRKAAEPWPNFPPPPPPHPDQKAKKKFVPPPPPPTKAAQYKNGNKKSLNQIIKETPKGVESGYELLMNGESHYYTINKGKKTYYNKDGYITDNKGNILPPPPPPPPKPAKKPVDIEEVEVPAPPPPPVSKNVAEQYAKANPNSITVTTVDGEVIEIVEIPEDQEGKTKINGKVYTYKIKDGRTTYYDENGKKIDAKKILPPPPPPTKAVQYKNGAKKSLNQIIKETPKGVESGYELLENGESHYYTINKGKKTYYNKDGYITDNKGNILPPPPPPPPAPKKADSNNRKSKGGPNPNYDYDIYSSDLRNEYVKKFKAYEAMRYDKPHYIRKSKKDKKVMSELWIELRQMHIYSLSKEEKQGLRLPTTPFAPYVKINLDGKSYYKLRNKLTPREQKTFIGLGKDGTLSNLGLDLIDENDPIVIPIENFELEPVKKSDYKTKKHQVFITVSEDGHYAISKDNTLKEFEKITLETLEGLVSNLSQKDRENTFIFTQVNDYKKFRSKPAKSAEYQDDIEVNIIKDNVSHPIHKYKGKYSETVSYQGALDNKPSSQLKGHVQKLADVFKKYNIKNITL
ncbi:M56 family metallopeptidase [Winogradskyella sp. A3E31]|uniref:M56 family metallopeptidase n=1 Tax=Winogradskyella sp. A3E31 TaxID=3349637 RepID=UPI00398B5762